VRNLGIEFSFDNVFTNLVIGGGSCSVDSDGDVNCP